MKEKTKPKILIIEDEVITAKYLKDILINFNYDIVDILNSEEGLIETINKKNPDLILMDIKLKGDSDGIKLTEQIKERYDIPIIYLTAHTDGSTLERAKYTEPSAYIVKPFREKDLYISVEMTLHNHKANKKMNGKKNNRKATVKRSEEIINVSINILAKEGIKKLTMRNIADKLDITQGALYKHFDTKEELYNSIIAEIKHSFDMIYSNFFKLKEERDIIEKIKLLIFEWCKEYAVNNATIKLLFSPLVYSNKGGNISSSISELKSKHNEIIAEIIKEAMDSGYIPQDEEPEILQDFIMNTVWAYIKKWDAKNNMKTELYNEIEEMQNRIFRLLSIKLD